ncbi:MAG: helicase-related protein, partial [Actinomycetota bacterium]
MFEKFGLWVPRLDQGRIFGAHPDDITDVTPGANPYDEHDVLLVSSHLARLRKHRAMILASRRFDLVVVDEAHHARRSGADLDRYQPSLLLQLLDELREHDHATSLWMLTATPMQVDPIELIDLLTHLGFSGPLTQMSNLMSFYGELAKKDDDTTNWKALHRGVESLDHIPRTQAEWTLLDRIERKFNPLSRERIERFGTPGADPAQLVGLLSPAERRELREWIRLRSPVGLFVTRHTRSTLKRLRDDGLLSEPLADRDVQASTITFSTYEQDLYDDLTALLDRLSDAHGKKKGVGFVLTVYRRRLTSSWAAIRHTITNRLAKEQSLIEDAILDDEFVEVGDDGDAPIDDTKVLPLTEADLDDLRSYLHRLNQIGLTDDAKYRRLTGDINDARAEGRAVIVFTQFTDTLDYLRDALQNIYGPVLASFTGDGGAVWNADSWKAISKKDLVDRVRARKVEIILATDAASEGLNLQALNTLINFDLPWNPMRVEQRIGRIDRLGQQSPTVLIRNYVIPGTVEESVYSALAERIDLFSGIVGNLQPILGATERAFEKVFRVPASEREQFRKAEIAGLLARAEELEGSGLLSDSDEDPWPDPSYPIPPSDLASLRIACIEDLDIYASGPNRPASFEPGDVSRDPQKWTALATFGHPHLDAELLRRAKGASIDPAVVMHDGAVAAVVRADRTPPSPVLSLDGLNDLGTPVAMGEAEDTATRLTVQERLRRAQLVDDALRVRRLDDNRRTFHEIGTLVRRAVNAESLRRRRHNEGLYEPYFVWKDLSAEKPWSHV